jgi:uncharacterized membrane protein
MGFLFIFYSFVFYSFLGWLIETTFVSINQKRFVNIGFLDGPFSPIYGFGALFIIFLISPLKSNLPLFFIMSAVITSILEYLTSYFFEKIFKITWWNYSKEPFNLHGRICLGTFLSWGFLSTLVFVFIHPNITPFINFFSNRVGFLGFIIFLIYFIIDATNTFSSIFKLKKILIKSINFNIKNNKRITRIIKSFPNIYSKIYNDIILNLKSKLK